jgi:hypothetical protein
LLPPVESTIYTSLDFAFAAGNHDMSLSFGSTGDANDNAAMETWLFSSGWGLACSDVRR